MLLRQTMMDLLNFGVLNKNEYSALSPQHFELITEIDTASESAIVHSRE